MLSAVCLTSMIMSIVVAAAFLSASIAYLHLPQELSAFIAGQQLGPYTLILILAIFYILIGLAIEGVSIFVTTLPIVFPLVVGAGFDPVWFGVFLVIMVELGTVSPPVGFNLFIIQGLTGDSMARVSWAALPFALLLSLSAALLVAFPSIALWLPRLLFDR
jgi:TRAP-type C4-dicarboxylate transport system permease large subunit